jgi:hypothetical protein
MVKRRADPDPGDFLRWLTFEAHRKHYHPRWVAIRFRARFHRWPTAADPGSGSCNHHHHQRAP